MYKKTESFKNFLFGSARPWVFLKVGFRPKIKLGLKSKLQIQISKGLFLLISARL
jgi:hypothetical protein